MIGHVLTYEGGGRYALQRVGTLRVAGAWSGATARAGDTSWQFVGSGTWSLRRNATASDAAGNLIGDYRRRGQRLRWSGRELQFRRASRWPTLGWRALFSVGARYVLADGERTFAVVHERMERSHHPVDIEVSDAGVLDPGLLLFLAFLVGWLDERDRNNDGL